LWLSRSWTTRERRPGEPTDAYVFVSEKEFEKKVEEGGFLEWARFLGHYYGTPWPDPPGGCDVLLEIDVQGAAQVKSAFFNKTFVLLILPPSKEALIKRMEKRGDSPQQITKRLEIADQELAAGRKLAYKEVQNDKLDKCLKELQNIIKDIRKEYRDGK
jgi:guanylate kinase